MNRKHLKIALVPVLAIGLFAVLRGPAETSESAPPRARRPEIPLAEQAGGGAAPTAIGARKRELAEIVSFDPFAPAVALEAEPAASSGTPVGESAAGLPLRARLRIEAIVKRDGTFQAIIGGKVVRTGDLIDEGRYRVTAITADDVTFSRIEARTSPQP